MNLISRPSRLSVFLYYVLVSEYGLFNFIEICAWLTIAVCNNSDRSDSKWLQIRFWLDLKIYTLNWGPIYLWIPYLIPINLVHEKPNETIHLVACKINGLILNHSTCKLPDCNIVADTEGLQYIENNWVSAMTLEKRNYWNYMTFFLDWNR